MENPHINCSSLRCTYFKFQIDEDNHTSADKKRPKFPEMSKLSSFCSVLEVSYQLH